MVNFKCPPLRTWDVSNAPNGPLVNSSRVDAFDTKVPTTLGGGGDSNTAIAPPVFGSGGNDGTGPTLSNLPCKILHPPPFGFLYEGDVGGRSVPHPMDYATDSSVSGALDGAHPKNNYPKAQHSVKNTSNLINGPKDTLSESILYLRLEDGNDTHVRTLEEAFYNSNLPLHAILSLLCLDRVQFIGDEIAQILRIPNPVSLPVDGGNHDWMVDHWDAIGEVISENMLAHRTPLDAPSSEKVVVATKVSHKQKVAPPLQVDRLQGRILQGNMDRLVALRDASETATDPNKHALSRLILHEPMLSSSRRTYNSAIRSNFCVDNESLSDPLCDTSNILPGSFRWILVCDGFLGNTSSYTAVNEVFVQLTSAVVCLIRLSFY